MSAVRAIVYDLDGTLIDSTPNITAAVNHARALYGLEPLTLEQCAPCIGDGSRSLVRRALFAQFDRADWEGLDERDEPFDRAYDRFYEYYAAHATDLLTVFDGVAEALAYWDSAGVPQAVLTNKPHEVTGEVLERLGLARHMQAVIGPGARIGDHVVQPKPDPWALAHLVDRLTGGPAGVWMVGDGPQDVAVAEAVGVSSVGIEHGQGGGRLDGVSPTLRVRTFRDAFEVLRAESSRGGRGPR